MLRQFLVVILAASWLCGSIVRQSGAQEVESKSYPVLSGVGLALNAKDGHLYVGKVVPKSPADESGLIPEGAQLVAIEVNGKETLLDGKTVGEAASLIRGPVGTELVLTVVPSKDGTAIKVRLIRAPLEIAGVSAATYKAFIGKPNAQTQTDVAGWYAIKPTRGLSRQSRGPRLLGVVVPNVLSARDQDANTLGGQSPLEGEGRVDDRHC